MELLYLASQLQIPVAEVAVAWTEIPGESDSTLLTVLDSWCSSAFTVSMLLYSGLFMCLPHDQGRSAFGTVMSLSGLDIAAASC